MLNIYIDESGSISRSEEHPYFIITFVVPENKEYMKKTVKRFVSNDLKRFKSDIRYSNMFTKDGKFKELKGSSLNFEDFVPRFGGVFFDFCNLSIL